VRTIQLAKGVGARLRNNLSELKLTDIDQSIKSFQPGEWCFFRTVENDYWLGFVNPLIDIKYPCAQVLLQLNETTKQQITPEIYIQNSVEKALKRRMHFNQYSEGARLIYGSSDGLPGIIADKFKNKVLIQINNAGMDNFRIFIQEKLNESFGIESIFLDNPKYRERESLPSFEVKKIPDIEVVENGLNYFLKSEVIQKIGFYYDHRENRLQMRNLLPRLNMSFENGLDLFCYAGAWGINALQAGVEKIDFVDQGDFSETVTQNLALNKFESRGRFFRKNVFEFLDTALSQGALYDLVLCDPPAFAKSMNQKKEALEGYSKLHRKVFKISKPLSICIFSSCTHYVSFDEFQQNILDASKKEKRNIQLLFCGIQGWDHQVKTTNEKANYIKSFFYLVE